MKTRRGGLALLMLALLAACGQQPRPDSPAAPDSAPTPAVHESTPPPAPAAAEGGWVPVTDSPLSPRERALGFWLEGRMIIVGGSDGPPCPPTASCIAPEEPPLRDGASYEPDTGEWTRIADAPMPLEGARGVVAGSRLYLLVNETDFLAYDAAHDAWWTLPSPQSATPAWRSLAEHDGQVIAYVPSHEQDEGRTSPDQRYDAARGVWEALEQDPLGPGFDRFMVGTEHGLVLLQAPLVDNPGAGGRPSLWEAAVLESGGRWRELPASDIATGYAPWVWAGDRVVAASTEITNGGGELPGDYGRDYPHGGMLDVAEGAWEPLPPGGPPGWRGMSLSAHDTEAVFRDGALLDVRAGRWTPVPLPPGHVRQGVTVVWGDGRLLLWGGSSFAERHVGQLHGDGWAWAPPED